MCQKALPTKIQCKPTLLTAYSQNLDGIFYSLILSHPD